MMQVGKIDTLNIHIHDSLLSLLGTGTIIKSDGVKLHVVLWTESG